MAGDEELQRAAEAAEGASTAEATRAVAIDVERKRVTRTLQRRLRQVEQAAAKWTAATSRPP